MKPTPHALALAGLAALFAASSPTPASAQTARDYPPGLYYSLRLPEAPPLPAAPPGWPLLELGGILFYDDRGVNPLANLFQAAVQIGGAQMALSGFTETGLRLVDPA
jgi:hypothetical protein